jgi:hypothetical protein
MADTTKERQQYALQTIFSFFLGLMVLAFIGIGVITFYPQPDYGSPPRYVSFSASRSSIWSKDRAGELSAADQARVDEIQEEIDALWEEPGGGAPALGAQHEHHPHPLRDRWSWVSRSS